MKENLISESKKVSSFKLAYSGLLTVYVLGRAENTNSHSAWSRDVLPTMRDVLLVGAVFF